MNKITLITGTSSGVGLETALLFAQKGYKVYASMRDTAKQDKLVAEAERMGLSIAVVALDVCDVASIEKAVQYIVEQEGRIDVLINNAGAGLAKTTEHATEAEIQWVTETNFLSVVRCTKAVLPIMRQQKSGHIINISSVGGLVGQPFNELYCAAKFAVEGYTEALATYLPQHFGIHLTAIEPGGIATEFFKSAREKILGGAGLPQDEYLPIFQKYIDGMQKRAASGENKTAFQQAIDVANVILAVAESPNPPIRIRTSDWANDFCQYKTATDPEGRLQTEKVARQFLGG